MPDRDFDQLEASLLFCPTCKQAMPVRKRLLLILPNGDKYEYFCARCSTTCGEKTETEGPGSNLSKNRLLH
jgi:hypothetical protein